MRNMQSNLSEALHNQSKLGLLLQKRKKMQQQIQKLKTYYHNKSLTSSEFYNQYERLGLQLFQINSEIHNLDDTQDDFLKQALQLS